MTHLKGQNLMRFKDITRKVGKFHIRHANSKREVIHFVLPVAFLEECQNCTFIHEVLLFIGVRPFKRLIIRFHFFTSNCVRRVGMSGWRRAQRTRTKPSVCPYTASD